MVKTAPLNHDTYVYLKKVQMTLFEKYKRSITIADILSGISNILTDVDDTAKKIIMVRRQDHEEAIPENTEYSNNGNNDNNSNGLRHPGILLVEDEDIKA